MLERLGQLATPVGDAPQFLLAAALRARDAVLDDRLNGEVQAAPYRAVVSRGALSGMLAKDAALNRAGDDQSARLWV